MTTTLTVQEAVDFVLDPASSGDVETRLHSRVAALQDTDPERVATCVELLAPSGGGEESEPVVLEALLVSSLAHPGVCEQWGVSAPATARRLAARYDHDGNAEAACAALRVAADHLPGNRSIERALGSLMRRQGMVQDLVDRYLTRAQRLLDDGRKDDAIPWLREVLLLDRTRKDVARMIRDLQFEEVARRKVGKKRTRAVMLMVVASALVSLVVLREVQVRREFQTLDASTDGSLGDLRDRLDGLEGFISDHPVWHGAFQALSARSALRVEIDRQNTEILGRREKEAEQRRQREAQADNARDLARMSAEAGDMQAALQQMERALELAADDWPHRERTEADIEALREVVEGDG